MEQHLVLNLVVPSKMAQCLEVEIVKAFHLLMDCCLAFLTLMALNLEIKKVMAAQLLPH